MEDIKKRKVEDEEGKVANGSGGLVLTTPHEDFRFSTRKMRMEAREEATNDTSYRTATTQEYLRSLLDPLNKSQLVDLLSRLGYQNPSIAEEIKGLASADPVHRKLFVRGLAWNTTSETLCDAFREHGEIEEGAVISDKATGKSRGYGFITYKYMESAKRALAAPSKLIDGRMAVCNLACEGLNASSATPDLAQRKLYIGGLAPEITSEILLDFFARHGVIEEGSVAYDKDTNESRGFGFVTYKTVEAARKAIDDPQKMLGGRTVTVKFADSHRGKTMHNQLPASMGPAGLPMTAGYSQPGKAHAGAAPVGYTYSHTMAPYPASSYPASSYPASSFPSPPAAPYQSHSQMSYAPAASKKDPLGASLPPPMGMGGYPYYHPKQ